MDAPARNNEDDPDYVEFHSKETNDWSKIQEDDSKGQTIKKINNILLKEFNEELTYKAKEVNIINDRIQNVQCMLDRLRAYITASYYGSGEKLIPMSRSVDMSRKRKIKSEVHEAGTKIIPVNKTFNEKLESGEIQLPEGMQLQDTQDSNDVEKMPETKSVTTNVVNRFYVNKKIIVGNISKYLLSDSRKENDKSTHKWMVYCRGSQDEPDISHYVKSVWFFLHPSYIPNDIVQVHKPPFQITRRGWGEFPVRVQIHFKDGRNKRFDIIHNLKLDKTYTGLQTLGAETVVNLELHRHAVSGDIIIENNLDRNVNPSILRTSSESPISIATDKEKDAVNAESSKLSIAVSNSFDESTSISSHILPIANNFIQSLATSDRTITPSLISSCVTSASISRCNSPELKTEMFSKAYNISEEHESLLRKLIELFPLIKPHNPKDSYDGYSCQNIELFKSWSFSKRRASEWQRAVYLRRAFIEKVDSLSSIPTTKQILIWCRHNCYTPCEDNLEIVDPISEKRILQFCLFCGIHIFHKNIKEKSQLCVTCVKNLNGTSFSFSSKTPFSLVHDEIEKKEQTITCLKQLNSNIYTNDDKDNIIDIINIPRVQNKILPHHNIRFEIPRTDEMDWIYNTCNDIGIVLTSSIHKSVKGPFSLMILRMAIKHFISELLRRSNGTVVLQNRRSFSPALVTVNAMCNTISTTKKFDFLQEIGLGKYVCDDNVKKKEK